MNMMLRTPNSEVIRIILNEYHTCKACGSKTQSRSLCEGGFIWQCKCGCTQRVWSCSKAYTEALAYLLA